MKRTHRQTASFRPVYTPATTEAFATYGVVDEGAVAQPVAAPEGVYPQFGGLEISTSSTALQALSGCCLANNRSWRARELMARLDELTGHGVFMELYAEHVYDSELPDVSTTYRELGLGLRSDRVTLNQSAPAADIREAIMDG